MGQREDNMRREAVANAYHSDNWKARVKKMSDAQIFALYQKFVEQKKI